MYKEFVRPILDHLDSETWHHNARLFLHMAEKNPKFLNLVEKMFSYEHKRFVDPRLNINFAGISLENPLMVGAGWDKNAEASKALFRLGFGGIEVGTVTELPQKGNPKPRQFMVTPDVCINSLGFNSLGMIQVSRNLEKYKKSGIPIGISLGKNAHMSLDEAARTHAKIVKLLYPYASYFAINPSSPNTENLRILQEKIYLSEIAEKINRVMYEKGKRIPLFVKIAPELSNNQIDEVLDVVYSQNLTGIIATNTTNDPEIKGKYGNKWKNQKGGLSGNNANFRELATTKIEYIFNATRGKIVIGGVGGISSPENALEKIMAGAHFLQLVTALRGEGLGIAGKINRELVRWMKKEGINNISEIVGEGRKNLPTITS